MKIITHKFIIIHKGFLKKYFNILISNDLTAI